MRQAIKDALLAVRAGNATSATAMLLQNEIKDLEKRVKDLEHEVRRLSVFEAAAWQQVHGEGEHDA